MAARESVTLLMGNLPVLADQHLESAERTMTLWETISVLPERQRVLLTLRWRDELSIGEIAAVLGLSAGAVKTGLTRAAQALRTLLPADFR
jgi:RNA polymerase sigma-70 factor (ECF subfamily)